MKAKEHGKSEAFLASAREALVLIANRDPQAWRIVEREVAYLVNIYLSDMGQYQRNRRSCVVDYQRFFKGVTLASPTSLKREWYIASLACTIVHESMHGYLFSLGFPYNKATRVRIERICVRRERRFAARLRSDYYDLTTIVPPFDPARWQLSWDTKERRKQFQEIWARFRQDMRK